MPLACRLLQPLFQNFVAQDRLEQGVDHLRYEPDLRDFLQSIHAYFDTFLTGRNYGLHGGTHLIDVHDKR